MVPFLQKYVTRPVHRFLKTLSVALRRASRVILAILGGIYFLEYFVLAYWIASGTLSIIQFDSDIRERYGISPAYIISIYGPVKYAPTDIDDIDKRLSDIDDKLATYNNQHTAGSSVSGESTISSIEDEKSTLLDKKKGLLEKIEQAKRNMETLSEQIVKSSKLDDAPFAAANVNADITSKISFIIEWNLWWLMTMPDQFRILFLTTVMGVLGSAMHAAWEYVRPDSTRSIRWYLFQPVIGGVSALVVFFAIKAGQITITSGDVDSLNPFFLSFMGVISGLLSDRAYARLQGLGGTFFGHSGEEESRWAFGLKAAMHEGSVGQKDLAHYLHVDPEEVKKWTEETTKVPFSCQLVISSYFRKPIRQLFTDLAPGDVSVSSGPGRAPSER